MSLFSRKFTQTLRYQLVLLGALLGSEARAVTDLLVAQPNSNSIKRFDGTTGAFKSNFIAPAVGVLGSPRGMAVGPDGHLYVADNGANRVKKFSLEDGSFIGDFTPADITNPVSLKFIGNDLYVLGGGIQRAIRRYDGTTGAFISQVVNASSTQISNAQDFLTMPGSNDYLIVSGNSRGARFTAAAGAFVNFFINSSGDLNTMNQPRSIAVGPDGNYWVSNRGSNRITRYSASTGAKLNDVVNGAPLNGPGSLIISGDQLIVANTFANEVLRFTITNAAAGTVSAPTVMIAAAAGLVSPEHIVFASIDDPPVALAGADFSIPGGEEYILDGTASYDPEGEPLQFSWRQTSGTFPQPTPSPVPSSAANDPKKKKRQELIALRYEQMRQRYLARLRALRGKQATAFQKIWNKFFDTVIAPAQAALGSASSGEVGNQPILVMRAPFVPVAQVFELTVTTPDGKTHTDSISVSISAPIDADNDGMPDRWEERYPGKLSTSIADGTADYDSDRFNNLAEYEAGTDPTSGSSFFRSSLALVGGVPMLTFNSVPGRHYRIEKSTDLRTWADLPGLSDIMATDFETTVSDNTAAGQPRGFYRVSTIPFNY